MHDFLDHLEQQLVLIASAPAGAASVATARRRRRPLLTGGLVAALTGATVFAMTGTSTAGLPILETETTDATAVRDRVPGAQAAGVDFAAAHAFRTPAGPGYVVTNPKTDALCLVIPDPSAPGDYGISCAASLATVERQGLAVAFPGDRAADPEATTLTIFVLPEGARDVQLTVGGSSVEPPVESGVAVVELDTEGSLRWTVNGRRDERTVEGPFSDAGGMAFVCPDGQPVTARNLPTHASRAEIRRARKAACTT